MAKFTIIGIDQGLASCGYGVIRFKKTKKSIKIDKVLDYGVIKTCLLYTSPSPRD